MTNAMPPAAMPNKAFFEKVGMFKAKSKELTFPVDQKRGAGHGECMERDELNATPAVGFAPYFAADAFRYAGRVTIWSCSCCC